MQRTFCKVSMGAQCPSLRVRRQPQPVRCAAASPISAPEPAKDLARALVRSVAMSPVVLALRAVLQTARQASNDLVQTHLSTPEQQAAIARHVRQSVSGAKALALAAAPFAAVSAGGGAGTTFLLITRAVASFIKMYLLLLFLRVLLSWFPTFDWNNQPWLALRQVTDPYLNLFRGIIPPLLGQIDLTPLVGFFLLQVLAGILEVPFESDDW